jgi:chemotaxis protein MotA
MDILSIIGIVVGVGAILLGQYLDGGHVATLINGPALIIVLGGSLGAIMLQSPLSVFLHAMKLFSWVFKPPQLPLDESVQRIVRWSDIARREGLLGLEDAMSEEPDPFIRRGMQMLVDGYEPESIRINMEIDMISKEKHDIQAAKVFEGMGAYAPTIGIIGAVLGLIHVMGNLADPTQLGSGIAVAFVATVYGVAMANLLFIPIGSKIKSVIQEESQFREMLIEGIVSIAEGDNPRIIQSRLYGFIN